MSPYAPAPSVLGPPLVAPEPPHVLVWGWLLGGCGLLLSPLLLEAERADRLRGRGASFDWGAVLLELLPAAFALCTLALVVWTAVRWARFGRPGLGLALAALGLASCGLVAAVAVCAGPEPDPREDPSAEPGSSRGDPRL